MRRLFAGAGAALLCVLAIGWVVVGGASSSRVLVAFGLAAAALLLLMVDRAMGRARAETLSKGSSGNH